MDNFHFWPLNEKSQLFCCSIVKLPIITQHTEQPLKPLGQPSKLFHILGDGNCLFRALSYVITGQQLYHAQIRHEIINHMMNFEKFLMPHMNTSLNCYLDKTGMAESGVWGTDIEILSASSLLSTDIFVYTKFGNLHLSESNSDSDSDAESNVVYKKDTQTNSFLSFQQNEKHEHEIIKDKLAEKTVSWPPIQKEPFNEYGTPFLATMAFPTLFPDGKGDPTSPNLNRDVPFNRAIKHLLKFGEFKNGQWNYRFAKHPRFSYWALNMIQRKRTLQQGSIFIKQNPGDSHFTIEEMREMASSNASTVFMSKLSRYVANITGSNAYWHKVRNDLKTTITTKGVPTIFFTLSSADMHWPELHSLFSGKSDSTNENRRQNVIDNPHIVDWFFDQRVKSFIKHWLYDTLGASWHWYRYEYQARGSIHCHGTAKLKNDPGLCELTEIALKGYIAEQNLKLGLKEVNQADIENGKLANMTVCNYVDSLLTTWNPQMPSDSKYIKPSIHPCRQEYLNISHIDYDCDYVNLLNAVQRHTRCSTNYCLRRKQNESDLKCLSIFHLSYAIKLN